MIIIIIIIIIIIMSQFLPHKIKKSSDAPAGIKFSVTVQMSESCM